MKNLHQGNIDNSTYAELKIIFNKLNNDQSHFVSTNDISTPIGCIEEMLDKIPADVWKKKDLKILDPCCGNGNFHLVALDKLSRAGHTKQECLENILYFNDLNKTRLKNVRDIFCSNIYNLQISQTDFLSHNLSTKFDIIYANPPFAKFTDGGLRAAKNHTLIRDFIRRALSLLSENGLLVFIVPDNWMSLADRNDIAQALTARQFLWLDIHGAKKWFPGVGSSFTWFVVQNSPGVDSFYSHSVFGKIDITSLVSSQTRRYIPLCYNKDVQSILLKTIDPDNEKFGVLTSSNLHKYTKRKHIKSSPSKEFRYRLIHTPKQTVWADIPHKWQRGWKVFISTTDKYKVFVDNCGMTQSIAFIRCGSQAEATRIKKILEHPLYVFLNNICRWGNFNNIRILQKLPLSPTTNVYEFFNLTKSEISLIEDVLAIGK